MSHTPQDIDNLIAIAREFANLTQAHTAALNSGDNEKLSESAALIENAADALFDATGPFATVSAKD